MMSAFARKLWQRQYRDVPGPAGLEAAKARFEKKSKFPSYYIFVNNFNFAANRKYFGPCSMRLNLPRTPSKTWNQVKLVCEEWIFKLASLNSKKTLDLLFIHPNLALWTQSFEWAIYWVGENLIILAPKFASWGQNA